MRLNSVELQEYQPNRYPFLMIEAFGNRNLDLLAKTVSLKLIQDLLY